MSQNLDELFIALQRLLPQHLLSRLVAQVAECKSPAIKNLLIRQFIRRYKVDLSELDNAEAAAYLTFNSFFTRPLKSGARPLAEGSSTVVSPVDGTISQLGALHRDNLIQAKGKTYTVSELLGERLAKFADFENGRFITLYLSPRDYHRVHMPLAGTLLVSQYIPGRLFSVNNTTTGHIKNLFARNERLACIFEGEYGQFAMVLVGALLVAGIESAWHGHYLPGTEYYFESGTVHYSLQKGEEMGRFRYGSTVILLFRSHSLSWQSSLGAGDKVRLGQQIGSLTTPSRPVLARAR